MTADVFRRSNLPAAGIYGPTPGFGTNYFLPVKVTIITSESIVTLKASRGTAAG